MNDKPKRVKKIEFEGDILWMPRKPKYKVTPYHLEGCKCPDCLYCEVDDGPIQPEDLEDYDV